MSSPVRPSTRIPRAVAARSSAFAFKGQKADVKEVAQKLGVDSVLEGTVRRSGNRLRVTWVYGMAASPADVSEVELRLAAAGDDSTTLELEHTAIVTEDRWAEYGPGAVGVGWDGGLLGPSLHLQGESIEDPEAWQVSDEGRSFYKRSSKAWGAANQAAGADPEVAAKGVANTTQFYAPDPEQPS